MATRALPERRDDQPAFVLHAYAYKETSLIVEAFTRDHGRVGFVARGAKRPRSELRGLLQAFQPITVSYAGAGELKTLVKAEWRGGVPLPSGHALLSGFYVNELLLSSCRARTPTPGSGTTTRPRCARSRSPRRRSGRRWCCGASKSGC